MPISSNVWSPTNEFDTASDWETRLSILTARVWVNILCGAGLGIKALRL